MKIASVLLLLVFMLTGCGVGKQRSVTAKLTQDHYIATGNASWYGTFFHGRKTASGVVFNKNHYSAAHRKLKLGSLIRVTNLHNNKKIVLMVNDRGPVPKDRILDVSEQTARKLGFIEQGLAKVRIEYLPSQTKKLSKKARSKKVADMYNYFIRNHGMFR